MNRRMKPNVPPARCLHQFVIHIVAGNRHLRKVGEQIDEQNLFGQKWKEREKKRRASHAEHVSEVRTRRDEDVLKRVSKSAPAFAHAIHQHFKIALEQDKIRGLARNIDSAFHRETYIRGVQRRCVVNSIAQVTDNVAGFFERDDDPLLLSSARFRQKRRHLARDEQAQDRSLRAFRDPLRMRALFKPTSLRNVLGDERVVSSDDL